MPPKFKFTEDEIVSEALELVRTRGAKALTARALAERLGCSAKPIFGLFKNMEELQLGVLCAADGLYERRISEAMHRGEYPPYKASGMEYIRFAAEEPELFRLLFMRDRRGEPPQEHGLSPELLTAICAATGLEPSEAERFHLEMWIFVHGIAVMVATGYLEWDMDFVSDALTHMYGAMLADKRGVKNGSDKN